MSWNMHVNRPAITPTRVPEMPEPFVDDGKPVKLSERWRNGKFLGYRKFIGGHHFELGKDRAEAERMAGKALSMWQTYRRYVDKLNEEEIRFIQRGMSRERDRKREQQQQSSPSHYLTSPPVAVAPVTVQQTIPQPVETLTVQQARDRFLADLRKRVDAGVVSDSHYHSQQYRLDAALVPIRDLPLANVDQHVLSDAILRLVRRPLVNKPVAKDAPPKQDRMSHSYATNSLKTLKWFFEWAQKWSLWSINPLYFADAFDAHPVLLDEERQQQLQAASGIEPRYLSIDELQRLYVAASPRVRLYILLGLNCGFATMEMATLKKFEMKLDRKIIERIRRKTQRNGKVGVYARWKLWPETVEAIRREMTRDPDQPLVLLTSEGKPLVEDLGYGRKDAVIQAWRRLQTKTGVDLSVKYLRKTAATMVRKLSGNGELADMLLSHSDGGMIRHYAPRDWDRLAKLTDQVRRQLQPMFDAAEAADKSNGPNDG